MKISDMLTPGLIKVPLQSETKEELFEEMVQLFVDAGAIRDREAALRAIFEREAKMSTGIAPGIGMPHARLAELSGLALAMGIASRGLEFESLDGKPVYLVFMLFAGVGNPGPHIRALADICRLFARPGFTEKLSAATSAREALNLIRQEE